MAEERRMGVGVGVMLLRSDRILLGRRHGEPRKASSLPYGAGTWTIPGGKIEFGESFEDAARRETLEETGIILKSMKIICVNNDIAETSHFVSIGFLSEDFEGDARVMEPDKITEWGWFALDELPRPLYPPSARVLKNYLNKAFYLE